MDLIGKCAGSLDKLGVVARSCSVLTSTFLRQLRHFVAPTAFLVLTSREPELTQRRRLCFPSRGLHLGTSDSARFVRAYMQLCY